MSGYFPTSKVPGNLSLPQDEHFAMQRLLKLKAYQSPNNQGITNKANQRMATAAELLSLRLAMRLVIDQKGLR
jgi:hypothetical protein